MADSNGENDASAPAKPAEPAAAAPAEQPAPPPLVVNAQYVKDLSLEVPNSPEVFARLRQAPKVSVDVDVRTRRLADNSYEVTLHIDCRGLIEDETVFIVEVAYGGVFTLNNVPQEHIRPILLVECPRLLFPFARGIIATMTREGGVPPLLINPIDFAELYRQQLSREIGASPAAGTAPEAAAAEPPPSAADTPTTE